MSFLDHGYRPPETCADCMRCPVREKLAEKYGGWLAVPMAIRAEVDCKQGASLDYATLSPVCGDLAAVRQRVQATEQYLRQEAANVNE